MAWTLTIDLEFGGKLQSDTIDSSNSLCHCLSILTSALGADDAELVRHVVVFKYKEGATDEQIQKVTDAFRGLKDKIPGIVSFEHGENVSPEGHDQGFTHVYQLTFESEAARDAYLPHPEHKAFGQVLRESGIFAGVFVVDYEPLD